MWSPAPVALFVTSNMSEQHSPVDFAAVLADPSRPLIVGGQAVNIWAEIYVPAEPALKEFAPFTSHDADIHGDRALAEMLHRRTGWSCRFFDDVRQIAVAILTKPDTTGTRVLPRPRRDQCRFSAPRSS